jgi:hypothetical protein
VNRDSAVQLNEHEEKIVSLALRGPFQEAVREGLEKGSDPRVYGAFDPDKDDRDHVAEAMEELRDAFIYLAMEYSGNLSSTRKRVIWTCMHMCMRLWGMLRQEQDDAKTLVRILERHDEGADR